MTKLTKITFFLLCLSLLIPTLIHAKKTDIEFFIGSESPNRSFSVISPIQTEEETLEDAVKGIKKKASKLKADAVVGIQCTINAKTGESEKNKKARKVSSFLSSLAAASSVNSPENADRILARAEEKQYRDQTINSKQLLSVCQGVAVKWK